MALSEHRSALRAYVDGNIRPRAEPIDLFFRDNAEINVVHPFNGVTGPAAYFNEVIAPLTNAFSGLTRTDYIAFAGDYKGADWATCTGYYTGEFNRPWLGIRPTNEMAHLRFGEFHRMENGRAVESYIFLDIPELMMLAGQWPIARLAADAVLPLP